MRYLDATCWCGLAFFAAAGMGDTAAGQAGWVLSEQKISHWQGGFGDLSDHDYFGCSVAYLGDFDGDGVGRWHSAGRLPHLRQLM